MRDAPLPGSPRHELHGPLILKLLFCTIITQPIPHHPLASGVDHANLNPFVAVDSLVDHGCLVTLRPAPNGCTLPALLGQLPPATRDR